MTEREQGAEAEADEAAGTPRIAIEPSAQTEALRACARLDAEAAAAYDRGARKIENEAVRANMAVFRDDHLRHLDSLNRLLTARGAQPVPRPDMDTTTALLPSLAAVADAIAPEALMLAFLANEELTNRTYDTLVQVQFDDETLAILQRAYADEERHLAYLDDIAEQLMQAESPQAGEVAYTDAGLPYER